MWAGTQAFQNPNGDFEVPLPKIDSIQCLEWAPRQNNFLIGGWDSKVRSRQYAACLAGGNVNN